MIRYLSHTEIDRKKWDDCIARSPAETIYPYSWYLDVVSPGWYALVRDDYEMVMPLTWKRKYGIRMLMQPLLAQQLGVFSPISPEPGDVSGFIAAISPKYLLVDICLNSGNHFDSAAVRQESRYNYELDISDPEGDPGRAYAENTLRNMRKGKDYGDSIAEVELGDYLSLMFTLKENTNYKPGFFEKLFRSLLEKDRARIYGIRSGGELHTAALVAYSSARCIYLSGSSNAMGKERRGMFLLMDHMIRAHRGEKKVFDFEGSMIPGVARFFQGFGAERKVYPRLMRNPFQLLGITS